MELEVHFNFAPFTGCPMLDVTLDTTSDSVFQVTVQPPSSDRSTRLPSTSSLNQLSSSSSYNTTLNPLRISPTPTNSTLFTTYGPPLTPLSTTSRFSTSPLNPQPTNSTLNPLMDMADHDSTCNPNLISTSPKISMIEASKFIRFCINEPLFPIPFYAGIIIVYAYDNTCPCI